MLLDESQKTKNDNSEWLADWLLWFDLFTKNHLIKPHEKLDGSAEKWRKRLNGLAPEAERVYLAEEGQYESEADTIQYLNRTQKAPTIFMTQDLA